MRLGLHRPAEHPLEGRPPDDDDLEVLVAGPRFAEGGGHRHRRATGREQLGEHVGEPVAQRHLQAGEEPVGVVDLGCATALGGEGLLGRGQRFDRVALEQRDLVPGPAQRERGGETTDAAPADQHPLRHPRSSALCRGDPRAMHGVIAARRGDHPERGMQRRWSAPTFTGDAARPRMEVTGLTDVGGSDAAAKAFVYGYPLVYDLEEIDSFVSGGGAFPVGGSFNELAAARDLLGPETTFVTPNNDTLYLLAMCDIRSGPLLLDVPDTTGRYFVLQLVDAWTNNFAYIGTRATGTGAGRFLLAAPGYDGPVPDGAQLVESRTGVFSIVGRIQVHGPDDLPAVRAVQDQFALTALTEGPPPAGVPRPDPRVADDLLWWERFRVALAAFPPPSGDASFVELCASFGLTDAESPYVDPEPTLAAALRAGQAAGQELIEALARGGETVNGWRCAAHVFDYNLDALGLGTIDDPAWKIADRQTAYATRAAAARAGLWGNHGYEADYDLVYVDADGEQLHGDHRYELRLPSAPPVGAFWSLSMYDMPDFHLVANPIDRYSIGNATPGLAVADDGSITITMSVDAPDASRAANWLPAPAGPFRPVLRMYMPAEAILTGEYEIPAIVRLD